MKMLARWFIPTVLLALIAGASAQTVTLQLWDYFTDGDGYAAMEDAIARYEAEHPDVDIERTAIGFGDLKARIIQAAATGTMPDIVIVDNPDHQAMAAQGALADLTPYIQDWEGNGQYFDGPWSSTIYQGKNYGVPYVSNATALFYNADLLEEAGLEPPTTWEELRSTAKTLTSDSRSGLCLSLIATEEGTFTYLPFLWGNGGDLDGLGEPANIEALQLVDGMMNEDKSISRAALNWAQGDVNNQFLAGQCAMMINGPWQLPSLEAADIAFNWNVAPWPNNGVPTSILGGENFAAGAGGNVEAAWDVIEWMSTPVNYLATVLISGNIPSRGDVAADPAYSGDPITAVFMNQVAVAKARAYGAQYPQISEQIMNMVQSVLVDARTPEQAASDASTAVQPFLP